MVAGSLMAGVVPYTLFIVAPGNKLMMMRWRELMHAEANGKAAGAESKVREAESRGRVKRWGLLNYGRALLPLAGAMVAFSAW